jgi:hypothetical protein
MDTFTFFLHSCGYDKSYLLGHNGEQAAESQPMFRGLRSFEMSLDFQQTKWRYVADDKPLLLS